MLEKEQTMAEESTPEVQESATEATTLDAILEGSIGEVLDKGEGDPVPSKEETQTSSLPDIPKEETETEAEGSEELDQKATGEEEETPDEEVSTSEETTEEAEETEESQDTSLSAPENWNSEDREMFDSLPLNAKERLLKREKEMTADYTRKTQDLATQRKDLEALQKVIEPAKQAIQATGISEAEYISRLLGADQALRANPKMALRQLAQGYGINLESLNESEDWNDPDPQYAQLQKQLQEVQGELNQFKQHNFQTARNETENQIQVFAETKDANGNLKHPHFDKLRVKMGNLIDAREAKNMEEAYNKALRLDDDLYEETLKTQRAQAKKEEEKKRKLAVEKARKVKPKTSANPPRGSVKTSDLDSLLMTNIEGAGITR
mgnify:FL=1